MPRHGEVVLPLSYPGSILILADDHIQSPAQAILHAPVLADNLVETLGDKPY